MKKLIYIIIALAASAVWSCQSSDIFKELPQTVSRFVSDYWPNPAIESFTQPHPDTIKVVIKNGPTLTFDSDYLWTEIDGNGMPLPQIFLFDQLPDKLYDYISGGDMTGEVFDVSRNPRLYTVKLLDSHLRYDIATATVTQQ
ncbi:MAG: PepSY-like domain-containing protein [Odoribacter sp.]|nr:PepSY-like domain-containing protein [Odoribacter sp.]